jgi:hypothetical protein
MQLACLSRQLVHTMKRLTLHSLRIAPRQSTQYRCLHVSAPAWEKVKVPQMAESISCAAQHWVVAVTEAWWL